MKPKNLKFNKYFRPKLNNKHKISKILYTAGIVSLEPSFITDVQLNTIILNTKRILKRNGSNRNLHPDTGVSGPRNCV